MGLNGVSFTTSGLAEDLNVLKSEYLTQSESIHDILSDTEDSLNIIQADYDDDGIYNGSSGHQLLDATLSLDGINKQMSFEEVNELLTTINDSPKIAAELEQQRELYKKYEKEYNKVQEEIKSIEKILSQLINEIGKKESEQAINQNNLSDAQELLKNTQVGYNAALVEEAQEVDSLQTEAYEKALEAFNTQEYAEGEDGYKEFSEFYDDEIGNISLSTEASEDAGQAVDKAKQKVSQYQAVGASINTSLTSLRSNYNSTNSTYVSKKTNLSNIKTNMESVTTQITQLQTQIANMNFVKENKEAIEKIAYNKDPKVIAAREATGVVFATDENGNKNACAFDLTKMLSAEELAIITNNNIDLSATSSNGSPRYLLARGNKDGKFHIYETGKNSYDLWAIARSYGNGGGYDIVPKGNGHLKIKGEYNNANEGGVEVYNLTSSSDLSAVSFNNSFKLYKTSSPLSLDLNGDGVKTSSKVVNYDIDGDGKVDKINDSADAVLVFDKDGDGISGEDGSECFGNNTDLNGDGKADGHTDGFAALKALALKTGLINGKDDNVLDEKDLKFLELSHGLKIKAGGYNSDAQSLADLGITQINLAQTDETKMQNNFDGMNNQLMTQFGATFIQNGKEKEYADIWHVKL